MKKNIVIVMLLMLTSCTQVMANLTGMEFLHDRRSREEILIDAGIEKNAVSIIESLSELNQKVRAKVSAYKGKVIVTGEAETAAARDKIIANIRIIKNIRVIYNELQLMPLAGAEVMNKDVAMRKEVIDALKGINDYSGFDETRVKVIVSASNVYLMGLLYKEEAKVVSVKIQKIENISCIVTLFEYIGQEKLQKEKNKNAI
jgi:osmotically-inducible protein OsmY